MARSGTALTSSKERVSLPPLVEKYLISWAMSAVCVDIYTSERPIRRFFGQRPTQITGRESFHDIT